MAITVHKGDLPSSLDFGSSVAVDSETLDSLRKLPSLVELDLGGSDLSDESIRPLAELRQLQVLNLSGTRVTDRTVDLVARLPKLKSLAIGGVEWSADAVQRLQQQRPDLEIQR